MSAVSPRALPYDPTAPLTASGNLRRRAAVSRAVEVVAVAAATAAVALLVDVVYTVTKQGAGALRLDFVTQNPSGLIGGGIANSIVGTAIVVALAAVLAVPVGILTGLYLSEFASPRSRSGRALKLVLDLLQGVPTIVVGIVVYGLIVIPEGSFSGFAGAIALAVVMLPLIARSSQEVLALVPGTIREAADALGVDRWRTVLRVILPVAAGGIVTGAILSIARAAGETAPMLVVNGIFNPTATQLNPFGHGVPTIPMFIYSNYDLPSNIALQRVWGAAFVLLAFILVANIGARLLLARSRRRMGL